MIRNYFAAALQNLARNGWYAGVTVLGLAIGFAAAILIGLYVRHELTYDQFVPGHERVFLLNLKATGQIGQPLDSDSTSPRMADDLKLDFPQIEYAARYSGTSFPPTVRRGETNIAERGFVWVDPDFFKVLPLPVVAGDPSTALASPDALVLSQAAARKYFGQDAPIGAVLQVDGHAMRVGAVIEDLPSNSHLSGDIFGSMKASFAPFKAFEAYGYLSNVVATYIRLKPGTSAAELQQRLPDFVARRIAPQLNRDAPDEKYAVTLTLKPLTSIHLLGANQGDTKPAADLKVLAGVALIGALIVFVAAINFVTLMTARAARRAVEVGVRKVVGAERRDLIVQFMGEAALYVAFALVAAVALAEILLPAVNAGLQRKIAFNYFGDPALLLSMFGAAIITGGLAGFYPAVVLSSFRPAQVLKGSAMLPGSGGGGARQGLVVAQFAVLISLLIAAATIYQQIQFSLKDGTHTHKDGVIMLFASPCTNGLRDAVASVRGVRAAACSSPEAINLSNNRDLVVADGRKVTLASASVDPGFFNIYGVEPLAGRLFRADRPGDDGASMRDVNPPLVLNESGVKALGFPSPQAAIGRMVAWHFISAPPTAGGAAPKSPAPIPSARASEVIGVVPDFTFSAMRQRVEATYFFVGPKTDWFSSLALNVKLDSSSTATTVDGIKRVWKKASGDQPIQLYFADQFLLRLYTDIIVQGGFIAVCTGVAISVACLGLFALSAYTAERRTKEIGVRKAMGADASDILRLLMWQYAKPVLLANIIAWPLSYAALSWWLRGFAYHIDPSLMTFIGAGLAALVVAVTTVGTQAWLVARAKPVSALRYE